MAHPGDPSEQPDDSVRDLRSDQIFGPLCEAARASRSESTAVRAAARDSQRSQLWLSLGRVLLGWIRLIGRLLRRVLLLRILLLRILLRRVLVLRILLGRIVLE